MDSWNSYQEMPHDQVDWANLAQQWMAMKETEPVDDRGGGVHDGGGAYDTGKPIFPSANLEPERYNRGTNDAYNTRGGEYWSDEWGQNGNGQYHPPPPQHQYGGPGPGRYPPYPPHQRNEPAPYPLHHRNEPAPYHPATHPMGNGGYEPFREPDRGYDRYRDDEVAGGWLPPANHLPPHRHGPMPPMSGGPPMGGPPHGFFNHPRPAMHPFDHPSAGPMGGQMKPATPPMFSGSFADLDATARKKLPAWILEGLEKAEREKQKQLEKEERIKRVEEERAKRRALTGKGKFDSDSEEENDDADDERSRTVSAPLFENDDGDPVFRTRKADPEEDLRTEEEKRTDAMTAVKFIMMSLLMDSTDSLLKHSIDNAIKSALLSKKEAAPKLVSKSSALAALSSLGDDDEEESASDVEESPSQANGDSNSSDAVTFKAPLGIPRNFSKPDPPKPQDTFVAPTPPVNSSVPNEVVKDVSEDTDIVKSSEDRKRKRSRSRSREKKRSRSKDRDRKRNRSREKQRSRSRERDRKKRSRSKERKRSRSRERKRSRSKERRHRSRSGSREKKSSRKRSRERKRSRSRSRSRERRHR